MRLHFLLFFLILACLLLAEVEGRRKRPAKKPAKKPAQKPPKKPAGKKPPVKGSCANVGPPSSPKIFKRFTVPGKKCPCWWDMTKKECACCRKGVGRVQQCGFPMHMYCFRREHPDKPQRGCPGVCNNEFTLSTKGFPCYEDRTKTNCAWCNERGYQCAQDGITGPNSKAGSRCTDGKNRNYCESQQGDCKHIPASNSHPCDVNAECKKVKRITKTRDYHQCKCNAGYYGNGLQCKDANGTLSVDPKAVVDLQIQLTTTQYEYPHNEGDYTYGQKLEQMFAQMTSAANHCQTDQTCDGSYNQQNIPV